MSNRFYIEEKYCEGDVLTGTSLFFGVAETDARRRAAGAIER